MITYQKTTHATETHKRSRTFSFPFPSSQRPPVPFPVTITDQCKPLSYFDHYLLILTVTELYINGIIQHTILCGTQSTFFHCPSVCVCRFRLFLFHKQYIVCLQRNICIHSILGMLYRVQSYHKCTAINILVHLVW